MLAALALKMKYHTLAMDEDTEGIRGSTLGRHEKPCFGAMDGHILRFLSVHKCSMPLYQEAQFAELCLNNASGSRTQN